MFGGGTCGCDGISEMRKYSAWVIVVMLMVMLMVVIMVYVTAMPLFRLLDDDDSAGAGDDDIGGDDDSWTLALGVQFVRRNVVHGLEPYHMSRTIGTM